MAEKLKQVGKYWANTHEIFAGYGNIDEAEIRQFKASHPMIMDQWIAEEAEQYFKQIEGFRPSLRNLRNRFRFWIEDLLQIEISKKHFKELK